MRAAVDAAAIRILQWMIIDMKVPIQWDCFATIPEFYNHPFSGSATAKLPKVEFLQALFDLGIHWQGFDSVTLNRIAETFVRMATYDHYWAMLNWLFYSLGKRDRTELRAIIFAILVDIIETSHFDPKTKTWHVNYRHQQRVRDPTVVIPHMTEWIITLTAIIPMSDMYENVPEKPSLLLTRGPNK